RRRPVRLLLASLLVVSLVAPSVVFAGPWLGWKSKGWRTQDNRPRPVPGPPAANLPNLDEVRLRHHRPAYAGADSLDGALTAQSASAQEWKTSGRSTADRDKL